MSYILDALRKAEAERKMGVTPDLSAMPLLDATRHRWRGGWRWWWALPALLAGALLGFAWSRWQPAPPRPLSVPETPPAVAPIVRAKPPEAVPAPRVARHVERRASTHKPPKKKQKSAPPKQQAAAPEPRIATLHELPSDIQRRIPPIATSGYLYSGNPADRSVLINKRLLHEGEQIAPGLTLEKLLPNGMVLSYQGTRFRAGY